MVKKIKFSEVKEGTKVVLNESLKAIKKGIENNLKKVKAFDVIDDSQEETNDIIEKMFFSKPSQIYQVSFEKSNYESSLRGMIEQFEQYEDYEKCNECVELLNKIND